MTTRVSFERTKRTLSKVTASPALGRRLAAMWHNRLPYYGGRLAVDHPAVSDTMKSMIFWRLYEAPEVRYIRRFVPGDLDVVDVGASIGATTFHLVRSRRGNARVVAVEANPALVELVATNCRLAAPGVAAAVVHGAVVGRSHPAPTVAFRVDPNPHCSAVASDAVAADDVVTVPAVTLSALREAHRIDRFALASDVEGGEAGFIFDDPGALDGCERLVIELHDTVHDGRQLRVEDLVRALVDRHGFAVLARHRDTFALGRGGGGRR